MRQVRQLDRRAWWGTVVISMVSKKDAERILLTAIASRRVRRALVSCPERQLMAITPSADRQYGELFTHPAEPGG